MSASLVGDILVGGVGLLHAFIFNLESLAWYRGAAKGFGIKPENYGVTATLAANQGFYNLVLAVGCGYSLLTGRLSEKLFFMTSIFACGIIGFITTGSMKIIRAQCLPTGLALLALAASQIEKEGKLDRITFGSILIAIVVSIGISLFVRKRIENDAAFFAKKLAQSK